MRRGPCSDLPSFTRSADRNSVLELSQQKFQCTFHLRMTKARLTAVRSLGEVCRDQSLSSVRPNSTAPSLEFTLNRDREIVR
jgi:hypothetical protein